MSGFVCVCDTFTISRFVQHFHAFEVSTMHVQALKGKYDQERKRADIQTYQQIQKQHNKLDLQDVAVPGTVRTIVS